VSLSASLPAASSSEREEKSRPAREREREREREGGPRARGGAREGGMGPHFYLRARRKRPKGVQWTARLAGTLRERHARTSSLPLSLRPSRTLARRDVFFFFSRRFCSLFDLLVPSPRPLGSRPFSCLVARRNSALAFSARSYLARTRFSRPAASRGRRGLTLGREHRLSQADRSIDLRNGTAVASDSTDSPPMWGIARSRRRALILAGDVVDR